MPWMRSSRAAITPSAEYWFSGVASMAIRPSTSAMSA